MEHPPPIESEKIARNMLARTGEQAVIIDKEEMGRGDQEQASLLAVQFTKAGFSTP
jgi:hypothetical protein